MTHTQTHFVIICKICAEDFLAERKDRTVCHKPECRAQDKSNRALKSYYKRVGREPSQKICLRPEGHAYDITCEVCGVHFESTSNRAKFCKVCYPAHRKEVVARREAAAKEKRADLAKVKNVAVKHSGKCELLHDPCGWYAEGMKFKTTELPKKSNVNVIKNRNFAPGTRFKVGSEIKVFDGIDLMDPEGAIS